MACPFFMPVAKLEDGAWPHPARLPLGCGWTGLCTAPGHEGESPSREALEQLCNLGYAESCDRLPRERVWDAVRFAVTVDRAAPSDSGRPTAEISDVGPSRIIHIKYVCERQHRPKDHGMLEFDGEAMVWTRRHSDHRVQKMAECFLETCLTRKQLREASVSSD